MKIKVAQVLGLNTDQKAAQVLSSIHSEDNHFFGLLNLICDDAFTKGREILSEISDLFFDFEGTPAEKLNQGVKILNEKLEDVLDFDSDSIGVDFILACLVGKVLYILGKGSVEVYLKRDGKISQLLSVGAPSDLISGFLQEDDRILFATKNLTTFLQDEVSNILALPLDLFEQEISERIASSSLEENGLSALYIEVLPQEELETIPILDKKIEEDQINQPEYIPSEKKFIFLSILLGLKRFIPKTNRGRLILALSLIFIIFLGLTFQFKTKLDREKNAQFVLLLQSVKEDFDAAKGLSSLNPADAKNKLNLAKDNLNKALKLKPKDQGALDLKKQIDSQESLIIQQFNVSEFPLFLDLDLVKKGFLADKMTLSVGKILLLDPNSKTLISLDINKKSNQILAGSSQLGQAQYASINGEFAFVYSQDKGILKIDSTNEKITSVSKADDDWGKILDIYAFSSNVYLLDALKAQIWKYLPTQIGYSDSRQYLSKGVKVDFANSLRLQIESSIYILQRNGEILRFTQGVKDNFSYQGLDKGVKDPKSFFVSSEADNLYILDSGNSRVLILTKKGEYKGQISGDKFKSVSDLVVDEKGKKIYLLAGSKIYTVNLK